MKRMFLFLLLLSFIQSCIPAYFDSAKVDTRFKRPLGSEAVNIRSLYVLAGGNLSSRAIADNLFMALESKMNQNKSKAEFKFYNTEQDYTIEMNVESILSDSFDGYLILSAEDQKWVDFNTEKYGFFVPFSSGYATGSAYGNTYEGNTRIELYNAKRELLYTGIFRLHFDPTKDYMYRRIVDKLIRELSEVKIHLW